ncbi:MAG TPA: phosphatidate cytidylyltransferase [Acidimicrobiales bacterium]|nr:phosphatidate cytidylyltransferase [Acidimicrobiales bacterium]
MDDDRQDTDSRVKIFGAEQAGHTGEVPAVPGGVLPGDVPGDVPGDAGAPEPGAEVAAGSFAAGSDLAAAGADQPSGPGPVDDPWPQPDTSGLPHWTEAPTGEVPAVLAREPATPDDGGDPWSSLPGPTWREEGADWAAHEESYEPSMLAPDDTKLGSLDDSGPGDRQPWSFDLPSAEAPVVEVGDFDTMVVPVVQPSSDPVRPLDDAAPSTAPGSTVFPEGGWSPAEHEAAVGPVRRGSPDAGRGRRRGAGRRRSRQAVEEELAAEEMAAHGLVDQPAGPDRPVPEGSALSGAGGPGDEPVADRPRAQAPPPPVGEPVSRPVPKASGPRRPPPRPRPGVGLRPPEPPRETQSGRNLPLAIASGVVIGVIALVFFDLGTVTSAIIATVVVTLAAVEAFAGFRKAGYHPATLLGLVAVVSLMVATYNKGEAALPLVLVLLVVFVMLWHLAGVERSVEPVRSIASTLLVFCWVGVFGSFATLLLDPTVFPNRHGIAFLLGAVITAVAYDVAALAVGAWIGSHPLSKFSPNKTWEGLIGGTVAAILAAVVIVHFIHPWTVGKAAVLGLVVAVVSPIGDLSESLIKRHLGVKDMGRILPGHGGLLDRIDGILFVLPATYYLVKAFHLA